MYFEWFGSHPLDQNYIPPKIQQQCVDSVGPGFTNLQMSCRVPLISPNASCHIHRQYQLFGIYTEILKLQDEERLYVFLSLSAHNKNKYILYTTL